MGFEAILVQYKFVVPEKINHSSYDYQKLFRALYGYTQNVTKSNGKTYHYTRKGILSEIPYIRTAKNTVIIPKKNLDTLINFFKTGKNPTHAWRGKGDWKVNYYTDNKKLTEDHVISALEDLVERTTIYVNEEEQQSVLEEMRFIANQIKIGKNADLTYCAMLCNSCEPILALDWFKQTYLLSDKLKEFKSLYNSLKNN